MMTSDTTTTAPLLVLQRPTRFCKQPIRFRDDDHVDHIANTHSSVSSDSYGLHKIKQVLAERHLKKGREFLVEIKGEPDENAKCNMGTLFIFECYSTKCH